MNNLLVLVIAVLIVLLVVYFNRETLANNGVIPVIFDRTNDSSSSTLVEGSREDCFAYPGSLVKEVGAPNDFNAGFAWYQALIADGAVIEEVDLTPLPIGSTVAPLTLTTTSHTAMMYHIDDQFPFPDAGTHRTLSIEQPVNSTFTLPIKGIDTAGGSSVNGDSMEFMFADPVGVFGVDTLDFESPVGFRGKIRAWDEFDTLLFEEDIETDGNGTVMFVGLSDRLNRMKTVRLTVGDFGGGSLTDVFAVVHINFGVSGTSDVCDVKRVITSTQSGITVKYIDTLTNAEIVDQTVIDSLIEA